MPAARTSWFVRPLLWRAVMRRAPTCDVRAARCCGQSCSCARCVDGWRSLEACCATRLAGWPCWLAPPVCLRMSACGARPPQLRRAHTASARRCCQLRWTPQLTDTVHRGSTASVAARALQLMVVMDCCVWRCSHKCMAGTVVSPPFLKPMWGVGIQSLGAIPCVQPRHECAAQQSLVAGAAPQVLWRQDG